MRSTNSVTAEVARVGREIVHSPSSGARMKLLTLLAFFVTATLLSAQTKQIAHRSHGGSPETFSLHASEDNFGLFEPPPSIDSSAIDSIFNKATRQLQHESNGPVPSVDSLQPQQNGSDSLRPSISNQKESNGRGTAALEAPENHDDGRIARLAGLGAGIALPIAALALFTIRRGERTSNDLERAEEDTAV